jgi:hypothetical protein
MSIAADLDDAGTVAHYSRSKHLAQILKQGLRFGPVACIADPRESTLDWIDTEGIGDMEHAPYALQAKTMKQSAGKYLRLLCTAAPRVTQPDSNVIEEANYGRPRMWAQYAKNGEGFCVVLNASPLEEAARALVSDDRRLLAGRVGYHRWLSMVSGGCCIQHGPDHPPPEESRLFEILSANEMLRSTYFKKSIDWQAEDEYRLLLYSERDGDELIAIDGVVRFVVLGHRFPRAKVAEAQELCRTLHCPCYSLVYDWPQYSMLRLSG